MAIFPASFKKSVIKGVTENIQYLVEHYPNIKNQLNITLELFTISNQLYPKKQVKKFVEDNQGLILQKYNTLISPRLQFLSENSLDLAQSAFEYFIDDFFEYAIYRCVESEDFDKDFEFLWTQFEHDFFSNEVEMQYLARLKNLYYYGGIGLDNLIPWTNVDVYWTSTAFEYRLLGWERKDGIRYSFLESFQPSWMVLRMRKKITNSGVFVAGVREATERFNLITFIVRNVAGGSVFFNDIRLFGFGHYSPFSDVGASVFSVADNDIYEEVGEHTTLDHPNDWFISNALKKCEGVDYSQYIFTDWQIRLRATLQTSGGFGESTTKRKYYLFNNLLGLTFVLNSLLPDLKDRNGYPSNRDNKNFRESFLPVLLANYSGMIESNVKQTITDLYEIRNCIAHGKNQEADREFSSRYGSLDKLADGLRFFEYMLNRLIMLSLVNNNLKNDLECWYVSGNSISVPSLIKPFEE